MKLRKERYAMVRKAKEDNETRQQESVSMNA